MTSSDLDEARRWDSGVFRESLESAVTVGLPFAEAEAWVRVIGDARLVLAAREGIGRDDELPEPSLANPRLALPRCAPARDRGGADEDDGRQMMDRPQADFLEVPTGGGAPDAPRKEPRTPAETLTSAMVVYITVNLLWALPLLVFPETFFDLILHDPPVSGQFDGLRWFGAVLLAWAVSGILVLARPEGRAIFVTTGGAPADLCRTLVALHVVHRPRSVVPLVRHRGFGHPRSGRDLSVVGALSGTISPQGRATKAVGELRMGFGAPQIPSAARGSADSAWSDSATAGLVTSPPAMLMPGISSG